MKDITDRLDKIQEDIGQIKQTLAVNTRELEIHIEGVNLAREQNDILKKQMEVGFQNVNADMKPIKSHVSFVQGAFWAVSICCAILIGLNELGILQKLFT